MCWFECVTEKTQCDRFIERLTREYIQIYIVGFFDKVGRYIASADQLYECITAFLSLAEHDDAGFSKGHHINVFNELFGECRDCCFGPKSKGVTEAGIHN